MVPLLILLLVFVQWQITCTVANVLSFASAFDIEISLPLPCLQGNSPLVEKKATEEES